MIIVIKDRSDYELIYFESDVVPNKGDEIIFDGKIDKNKLRTVKKRSFMVADHLLFQVKIEVDLPKKK